MAASLCRRISQILNTMECLFLVLFCTLRLIIYFPARKEALGSFWYSTLPIIESSVRKFVSMLVLNDLNGLTLFHLNLASFFNCAVSPFCAGRRMNCTGQTIQMKGYWAILWPRSRFFFSQE